MTAIWPPLCRAADWSLTDGQLQSQPVQFSALTNTEIRYTAAATPATLPLTNFVSLHRTGAAPASTSGPFLLLLTDGQRLAGEPKAVSNEQLIWTEPLLGDVPLPLEHLKAIARGNAARLADLGPAPKQDIATLANGDSVAGVFTGCSSSAITLQTDAGNTDVPLSSIARVVFAAAGAPPKAPTGHRMRVELADGSILLCPASGDDHTLTLVLAGQARSVALDQVISIEQENGPVTWLSSLTPVQDVQLPYFGQPALAWPARFDAAVDGAPLRAGGRSFEHGIGVHAYSRLTFDVAGAGWQSFRTQFAIDASPQQPARLADVTVRLLVDDHVLFERQHVRVGELLPPVQVPLPSDARRLTLECGFGDAADVQARLNWLEPALMRAPPATQP